MELILNDPDKRRVLYSPEDHDKIAKYTWSYKEGYAVTKMSGKAIRMHRYLLNCPDGFVVDHINNDTLDNQRHNLRILSIKENSQNKQKLKDTKFFGVGKKGNKFTSSIGHNSKTIYIGLFESAEMAAEYRDMYIVHMLPNSFYKLNFPEKRSKYIETCVNFHKQKYTKNINKSENLIKTIYKDIPGQPGVIQLIIPSKPNAFVTIDKSDYDKIKGFTYHISRGRVKCYTHLLHRFIMDETDINVIIDHIDRNPLNNTRTNLRRSNNILNSQNRTKNINTTSKYIGISFEKAYKKWRASVMVNGKTKFIGRFETEYIAALERDKYILKDSPESHHTLNVLERDM